LPVKIFQTILFTYPFQLCSEWDLKQEFKPKYVQNALFLVKNRKKCFMLPAAEGIFPRSPH